MTPGTRLAHKNCVITAAAAGIGRATARAYAREGARVLAADIDAAALASLAREDQSIRTAVLGPHQGHQLGEVPGHQTLPRSPGPPALRRRLRCRRCHRCRRFRRRTCRWGKNRHPRRGRGQREGSA